jgi:hypothetical protein
MSCFHLFDAFVLFIYNVSFLSPLFPGTSCIILTDAADAINKLKSQFRKIRLLHHCPPLVRTAHRLLSELRSDLSNKTGQASRPGSGLRGKHHPLPVNTSTPAHTILMLGNFQCLPSASLNFSSRCLMISSS